MAVKGSSFKVHKNSKNILAFAREAGGARAIAPVCRVMRDKGWELLLLAKDHALDIFKNQGLDCVDFPNFDEEILNRLTDKSFGSLPTFVFTSATSLPTLDMTEKYLWRWGQRNNIPTAGLVDQWQNYALRFSGRTKKERLAYLPDYIFAMDELAKSEMIKDGIPQDRIVITGQPALDRFIREYKMMYAKAHKIRRGLKIPPGFIVVTFVAESLKKDFGKSLGYDEQTTLRFLEKTLSDIAAVNKDLKMCLLIRLHPENKVEEFRWILSRLPTIEKRIIQKELKPFEVIAVSDIVVGMTSIILIEAILVGKITVSLQINSIPDSQSVLTRTGVIPFIKDTRSGKNILSRLLKDKGYKRRYLARQRIWKISRDGARNCVKVLNSLLEKRA